VFEFLGKSASLENAVGAERTALRASTSRLCMQSFECFVLALRVYFVKQNKNRCVVHASL
jgi:hypothetical protein